jgi:hypothetical protein
VSVASTGSPSFGSPGSSGPLESTVSDGAVASPIDGLRVAAAIGAADKDDASTFLGTTGVDWKPVVVDGRSSLCEELAGAGDLILAAQALDRSVADCLADRGRVVVSYDEGGTRLGDQGALLSTRVGLVDNLAESAAALKGTPWLGGSLLIVTTTDRKALVATAARRLRAEGQKMAGIAIVDTEADVTPAVLSASRTGADTVAFALPTSLQSLWVTEASVLDPGTRYLVADAADAIAAGRYPPGTTLTAYTALRLPWYRAKHGATPAQQACDQTRPASITSYLWCENARVATELATSVAGGADLATAARRLRVESPLTSDLAPIGDQSWGPADAAVVGWDGGCSCWSERRPFAPRPEAPS